MPKKITATAADWTGSLTLPNKIDHDTYQSALIALAQERQELHDARDAETITFEECQTKLSVLHQLDRLLFATYEADSLPAVEWTQEAE